MAQAPTSIPSTNHRVAQPRVRRILRRPVPYVQVVVQTTVVAPAAPPTPVPAPAPTPWDLWAPVLGIGLLALLLVVPISVVLAGLFGAFDNTPDQATNPPVTISAGGQIVSKDVAEFMLAKCEPGYARIVDMTNRSAVCVPDWAIDRTGQNVVNPPPLR